MVSFLPHGSLLGTLMASVLACPPDSSGIHSVPGVPIFHIRPQWNKESVDVGNWRQPPKNARNYVPKVVLGVHAYRKREFRYTCALVYNDENQNIGIGPVMQLLETQSKG